MFNLSTIVYIQISPACLTLKDLRSGETIAEVPEVAITAPPKSRVVGLGSEARLAAASDVAVQVLNPFAHPRSMVSDFTSAVCLLKAQLGRLGAKSIFRPSPTIVMHPLGSPAGGFTQVELRAFREMGMSVGASKVFMWTGRSLTDDEVRALRAPDAQGHWE